MFPQFDPSKMDPQLLMQLTQLVQQLPPEKIARMQSLMHNMMAGFDVRKELEEFEKGLPPGFRDKLASLAGAAGMGPFGFTPGTTSASVGSSTPVAPSPSVSAEPETVSDITQARRVILQAVADGRMTPEEAEKLLFV